MTSTRGRLPGRAGWAMLAQVDTLMSSCLFDMEAAQQHRNDAHAPAQAVDASLKAPDALRVECQVVSNYRGTCIIVLLDPFMRVWRTRGLRLAPAGEVAQRRTLMTLITPVHPPRLTSKDLRIGDLGLLRLFFSDIFPLPFYCLERRPSPILHHYRHDVGKNLHGLYRRIVVEEGSRGLEKVSRSRHHKRLRREINPGLERHRFLRAVVLELGAILER